MLFCVLRRHNATRGLTVMAQSRSEPQSVDSELNPFAFRAFGTGSNIADTLIR